MKEVSCQTAALVVDSLERRGIDPERLWGGLPVTRTLLADRTARIDWETWVELMQRAEDACGGPTATEVLFAQGAGRRTGHLFVSLANAFVSLADLYGLFARWGLKRTLTVMDGRFELIGETHARFVVDIDPGRQGSRPTLRFIVGVLRSLPTLQGLEPAAVSLGADATAHHATYQLVLPRERRFLPRARRLFSVARGAAAALDALEEQSVEIGAKNAQLERQVGELRESAAALKERDEWLELALDAGRVAIWQLDLARRTIRGSAGLAPLLGLPEGAVLTAEAWRDQILPDDRERVSESVARAIALREPIEVEYRLERGGEIVWVRGKGRVLVDSAGRPAFTLGTLADVTEQKSLEARLRFADRFISAGTLAAGVAHEINNPLAYVLGNVELLRRRLSTDEERARFAESLDDMTDGLARIRDVVRDLLSLSRPDEEAVGALDVRRVLDVAIRIVSPSVKHRARVETHYDDDTPFVLANESRLGQVFMNLVLNASQAMPERSQSESLIEARTKRAGDEVVIEIADNGVGIAPRDLPRVFDPFFTTKEIGVGTGLGLSVCQSIVTALKGRIEVHSEPGRGTTFRVVLPAISASAGSARPVPAAAPSVSTLRPHRR